MFKTPGYIGKVTAAQGFLLGGAKHHLSEPFALRDDAEAWACVVADTNREAGRNVRVAVVVHPDGTHEAVA